MASKLTEVGKRKKEFQRLADQLMAANTHLYFAKKLDEAEKGEFRIEFYKSKDFWHCTIMAHIQIAVVHLCRIFDHQEDNVRGRTFHLLRFVEKIDEAKLTDAQKKQRRADLEFLQKAEPKQNKWPNPKVVKLRKCRCKLVTHLDYDWAIDWQGESKDLIDISEIESLIEEGFSVLQRWALFYEVKYEIQKIVSGKDDYMFVLESLHSCSGGCGQ